MGHTTTSMVWLLLLALLVGCGLAARTIPFLRTPLWISGGGVEVVSVPTAHVNWTESLIKRFDSASTAEEIFELAEEIPAIARSVDKAMRIVIANNTDAVLASHAIQRLANLTKLSHSGSGWIPSSQDRRFEQLSECVELRASQMSTLDLSRYCWGLSLLKIGDEEQVRLIFDEYSDRLGRNSTTSEELATMMWTVGCLKEAYEWSTNSSVVQALSAKLLGKGLHAVERLNARILVRVLWTLALHSAEREWRTANGGGSSSLGGGSGPDARRKLSLDILSILAPRADELSAVHALSALSSAAKLTLQPNHLSLVHSLLLRLSHELAAAANGSSSSSSSSSMSIDFCATADALAALYQQTSRLCLRGAGDALRAAPLKALVERTAGALIDISTTTSRFPSLPMSSVAALVRLAVLVEAVEDRVVLTMALQYVHALFTSPPPSSSSSSLSSSSSTSHSANGNGGSHGQEKTANAPLVSPPDAASLLESVAMLTWTVRRERGFHALQGQRTSDDPYAGNLSTFLGLQRLAGHMSSICSLNAARLRKSWASTAAQRGAGTLLSALWASATFCRPCQVMRRSLQDELLQLMAAHEQASPASMEEVAAGMTEDSETLTDGLLGDSVVTRDAFLSLQSPSALAKLAVIVAEKGIGGDRGSATYGASEFVVTLDGADFASRLAPCVSAVLREVFPGGLQVAAAIALAELSSKFPSVPGADNNSNNSSDASLSTSATERITAGAGAGVGLDLGVAELSKLRTSSLLKFLWSASRLPDGFVCARAFEAGSQVLLGRNISVGYATGRYSSTSVQSTEFMLLARLLVDARKPNGRHDKNFIDAVLRNIVKALMAHLPQDPSKDDAVVDNDNNNQASVDFVALSEILRALLDFRVYHPELVGLCERCVKRELTFHARACDSSSSSCRRLYDLGRLEGFLQAYKVLSNGEVKRGAFNLLKLMNPRNS